MPDKKMKEFAEDTSTDNYDESIMTVSEVAQLLSVHVNTLRRWSNRGIMTTHRIGPRGDRRYTREDVVRFLAGPEANRGE